MRTIIAGSRTITSTLSLYQAVVECDWEITEVVCGCADGADLLGFYFARKNGIPVRFFPAWPNQFDWALQNARTSEFVQPPPIAVPVKAAGFVRNGLMAADAEALILIWDGKSRGSADMLRRAETLRRKVFVKIVEPESPRTDTTPHSSASGR